jgi:hypothetical protein
LRLDRANWLASSADAWTLGGRRDLTGSSGEFVRTTGRVPHDFLLDLQSRSENIQTAWNAICSPLLGNIRRAEKTVRDKRNYRGGRFKNFEPHKHAYQTTVTPPLTSTRFPAARRP